MTGPYYGGDYIPSEFWNGHGAVKAKWEDDQPDAAEIQKVVEHVRPQRVIEFGCGPGRNVPFFATASEYLGIDISWTYLNRARKAYPGRAFVHKDIGEALIWMGPWYDLAFCDSTLQHVRPGVEIENAVKHMAHVSDRWICVIEYTKPSLVPWGGAGLMGPGSFFDQIHLFQHDYTALFKPYAKLRWNTVCANPTQPAVKEAFLWEK